MHTDVFVVEQSMPVMLGSSLSWGSWFHAALTCSKGAAAAVLDLSQGIWWDVVLAAHVPQSVEPACK